jgi:hypothetical protein
LDIEPLSRHELEIRRPMADADKSPGRADRLDEQLDHMAEELIAGDSDDPPLSEEAVVEMLQITSSARRLDRSSDV